MWFSAAASVFAVQFFAGAVAHGHGGWDWVHGLPKCWESCLKSTSDGCNSKSCICDSSQDDDYLTSAVECVVRSCGAEELEVDLTFLAPLQMYCAATGDDIPDSVMSSAYACATATATSATPSPTRKVEHSSQENNGHKTTKEASNGLESTVTSTVTLTTTNGEGSTLQVLIPIVMGPSTMTTGEIITSTLDSKSTASPAASSTPEPVAAAPTQAQDSSSPSATAKETNIGQGSPFDISQGGAAHWDFSGALAGAGLLLGVLLRL